MLKKYSEDDVILGRHKIIVFKYDWPRLKSYIEKYVAEHGSGENWDEIGTRLARFGHWEFEDYKPYIPSL